MSGKTGFGRVYHAKKSFLTLLTMLLLCFCLFSSDLSCAVVTASESTEAETEESTKASTDASGSDDSSDASTDTSSRDSADASSDSSDATDSSTENSSDGSSADSADGSSDTSTEDSAISISNIQKVSGGKFVKRSGQYYYRLSDGTYAMNCLLKIKGKIYYFSKTGRRKYGWQEIDGDSYYFGKKSEGYMYKKKWLTYDGDRYYLTSDGTPATGWKTINSKRYYFSKAGVACRSKKTIDGTTYYFSSKTGALLYSGAKISISADCAVLINAKTGEILYDKNGTTKHANASTTKIMTCILALENSKLKTKVTASANAAAQEPTKIYLHQGEVFYMKDLLYGLMLPSGNDAAVAIAEHISGSTKAFAKLMNKKAKEIGCTSTHFVTPNGLDAGLNHYTTAQDLAKIAAYAYKNSTFRKIIRTQTYSFTSLSGYSYYLTTTNALLGNMSGVTGMKTGYTNKAGYCFVGSVKSKGGDTYIAVVLGGSTSESRWSDARKLLSYAYKLK
ncbi:MAG: D-alanyl-D-alanine carboxypeptidase [Lachnospiraceae bacterium]|nr:D-alanyl-D-alanine carboxypeptidase [Lachnospiraceae bacterium]